MQFEIPKKETVSPGNRAIYESLEQSLGAISNLHAIMTYSGNGLVRYLSFQNSPSSLSIKEKEIINLVVSQANACQYGLSEHTFIAKMNGFPDEEILKIRKGNASDKKWNVLAAFVKNILENKGFAPEVIIKKFFNAGYGKDNLVDVVLQICDAMTGNILCNLTGIPVDFPPASPLDNKNKNQKSIIINK